MIMEMFNALIYNVAIDKVCDTKCIIFNIRGCDIDFLEWVNADNTVERIDSHLAINQEDDINQYFDLWLSDLYDFLDAELVSLLGEERAA